jgi:hypothetical protein
LWHPSLHPSLSRSRSPFSPFVRTQLSPKRIENRAAPPAPYFCNMDTPEESRPHLSDLHGNQHLIDEFKRLKNLSVNELRAQCNQRQPGMYDRKYKTAGGRTRGSTREVAALRLVIFDRDQRIANDPLSNEQQGALRDFTTQREQYRNIFTMFGAHSHEQFKALAQVEDQHLPRSNSAAAQWLDTQRRSQEKAIRTLRLAFESGDTPCKLCAHARDDGAGNQQDSHAVHVDSLAAFLGRGTSTSQTRSTATNNTTTSTCRAASCKAEIPASAAFCPACGHAQQPTTSEAPATCRCGKSVDPDASFCQSCGTRKETPTAPSITVNDTTTCACGKQLAIDATFCAACGRGREDTAMHTCTNPTCLTAIPSGATFCPKCGVDKRKRSQGATVSNKCPHEGCSYNDIKEGDMVCGGCGTRLQPQARQLQPTAKRHRASANTAGTFGAARDTLLSRVYIPIVGLALLPLVDRSVYQGLWIALCYFVTQRDNAKKARQRALEQNYQHAAHHEDMERLGTSKPAKTKRDMPKPPDITTVSGLSDALTRFTAVRAHHHPDESGRDSKDLALLRDYMNRDGFNVTRCVDMIDTHMHKQTSLFNRCPPLLPDPVQGFHPADMAVLWTPSQTTDHGSTKPPAPIVNTHGDPYKTGDKREHMGRVCFTKGLCFKWQVGSCSHAEHLDHKYISKDRKTGQQTEISVRNACAGCGSKEHGAYFNYKDQGSPFVCTKAPPRRTKRPFPRA